ncbi:MAG: PAS domain-containing protein [Dehalococcoidia bacterium]|nr:PAS domain-containing protein [Dehalococcoidia bacterium]MDD5494415.1 PAS domain-containing protein [Dehalococcoidia bacterium]
MQADGEKLKGLWWSRVSDLRASLAKHSHNIPDFKYLVSALEEIDDMIQTITENVPEGIVITQDGKHLYGNKAAAEIFGYTREEIVGLPVTEVTLPAMRESLLARDRMIQAGDSIARIPAEWPCLRKDRTVRYVRAFAYRIIYLGKPASLVFFFDITEKKRMEDELAFNSYLLNMVTDSVFLLGTEGNIAYVNQAACETRGYTREELLRMNFLDITTPELRHKAAIRVSQFSEKKESRFHSAHTSKDGVRIPVEIRGKIIKRGGKPFVLCVARDTPDINGSNGAASAASIKGDIGGPPPMKSP